MQIFCTCIFILIALPIFWLFLQACFVIAVPTITFCLIRSLRNARKHHTQPKYIHQLENNKDDLIRLDIDELNELRWQRSRWRVPILRVHRNRTWYGRQKFKEDVEAELEDPL